MKKRSEAQRDVLISDDIWCSLAIYNNTWFLEIPRAVLGHGEQARLEWLHVWYLPLCCMNGRFVALYFWHDEAPEEMTNWKMVETIWCWLLGAVTASTAVSDALAEAHRNHRFHMWLAQLWVLQ